MPLDWAAASVPSATNMGGIDGSGIEEEAANDFLDLFDARLVKWWGGVWSCCELCFGSVLRLSPVVG